ncbi:MAG: shikimate kinase [Bacteroidetes bacterium]|nr:shikimate kinase [Bacteroidota bacterium]
MKIFLTGYMGSGKSTVGKRLAEKLNLDFIDFDRHIEQEKGKTIAEIFDAEGEEKFRLLEREHLIKLLAKDNAVISLGGGSPCFHNNMEIINKNGTSVYIEMDAEALVKRLADSRNKRPLIRGMNEVDLKFFIETNLKKRQSIYRQAHHTIKVDKQNSDDLAAQIIKLIS